MKPCPFCGEEKDFEELVDEDNFRRVRCMNCGALGPDCVTWLRAKAAWEERKSNV